MSDSPQSEADKIRNKRLAKLGGVSSSVTGNQSASGDSPQNAESSTSSNPSRLAAPTAPDTQNDETATQALAAQPSTPQVGSSTESPIPSKITITPRTSTPTRPKALTRSSDSIDSWTDKTITTIFQISLRPEQKTDTQGNRLILLPGARSELEDSDAPLRFNLDNLEQAILEAASNAPNGKPLVYLLGCWKRVMRLWRVMRGGDSSEPKLNILKEAKRLCMSYCIFAATMPEMFGQEPTEKNLLAEQMLSDPENDTGVCHDFLAEAISRFAEDESIKEALVSAIEQLSSDLSKLSMIDNFKPYVLALRNCVRYGPLVDALTASPNFLPTELAANEIEHNSTLGPFFALSPVHKDVSINYFAGARTQGESFVANNQNSLRMTLRTHQDELFDIANCIIKSAKEPREKLLDWFAFIVNKNHKRRATHMIEKEVSSDGFMLNVTVVLDRLCEPFMDSTFSKVDRIDVDYLRRSPRVVIEDETKINADQKTSDAFYAEPAAGTNNFISEVFFLTVAAHHYGSEALNERVTQLQRELKHFEKELAKLETERPKYATNPANLAMFERALKKYKDQAEQFHCTIRAIQGVLLDELSQQRSMQFTRYIVVWLLRIVDPESQYPKKQLSLPLPEQQPLVFRCLPEYFLQDIVDNFKYITRNMPHIILASQCEELVTICITFLTSSDYVKNPYLKSGLVSILYHGVWPIRGRQKGLLGDILNSSPFSVKHLLHALMMFYIEAETTGGHNQFYDKFNIRYEIFSIIRSIWTNPVYRENLRTEARVNVDFFVRFVNLQVNDVTYFLDESFTAFGKIHVLQELLENANNGLGETEKQEKEESLEQEKRRAKSNMQFTNDIVSMLKLFTESMAEVFTMPEVVQRLADMLDYNLESMVGPKQGNLKVRDPQSYEFSPSVLLSDIMSVYINLKDQPNFQLAVARDDRSYKPYNFEHAAKIIAKTALKSPDELKVWRKLAALIEATREADKQAQDDLGEVPEELLDPIMFTLMEDPVILPSSRATVDRSTIRSYLLSDPQDPFNRQPLKIEDVIPDKEMKEKIDKFKADARQRVLDSIQASQSAAAKQAGDEMDLS